MQVRTGAAPTLRLKLLQARRHHLIGHTRRRTPVARVQARFGKQLDQGAWQSERNVPDVKVSSQSTLSPHAEIDALESKPFSLQSQESFNWTEQWYPVAVAADLDPSKPHATKLLGDNYVIFQDGNKEWKCLEDKCSHRLAPLSQGRIEPADGSIMCSYHGWRFNGKGQAVSIPQANFQGPNVETAACKSDRSCVKSFPTQERGGLLFVWPVSGPEAFIHSAAVQPAWSATADKFAPGEVSLEITMQYQRDFPVPYDIMVENLGDQSHVPFAHHGVAGNRTSEWASHFKLSNVNKALDQPDGYTYDLEWSPDGMKAPYTQNVSFVPPSFIEYVTPKANNSNTLWFYCTPLDEHNCRVFSHSLVTDPLPRPVSWLLAKRPRWLDHLLLNQVFDGDIAYLHQAAIIAKSHDATLDTWAKEYYLASAADRSVTAMRKWFHGPRGRSGPFTQVHEAPALMRREEILDRYSQHVKHCPSCSKALRGVRKGQQLSQAAGVASFLVLASQLGRGAEPLSWPTVSTTVAGLAFLTAVSLLKALEKKFTYEDYNHAR